MNDDAFARLVAEEIKNRATPAQREYLQLPENWGRWQRAIQALNNNLENQIRNIHDQEQHQIAKYSELGDDARVMIAEMSANFEERRRKIERFRYHVAVRLDEVTRMIALGSEHVEERLKTVEFLRRCIEKHREVTEKYDIEPTPIDVALWSALDGKWGFDAITEEDILSFSND